MSSWLFCTFACVVVRACKAHWGGGSAAERVAEIRSASSHHDGNDFDSPFRTWVSWNVWGWTCV